MIHGPMARKCGHMWLTPKKMKKTQNDHSCTCIPSQQTTQTLHSFMCLWIPTQAETQQSTAHQSHSLPWAPWWAGRCHGSTGRLSASDCKWLYSPQADAQSQSSCAVESSALNRRLTAPRKIVERTRCRGEWFFNGLLLSSVSCNSKPKIRFVSCAAKQWEKTKNEARRSPLAQNSWFRQCQAHYPLVLSKPGAGSKPDQSFPNRPLESGIIDLITQLLYQLGSNSSNLSKTKCQKWSHINKIK